MHTFPWNKNIIIIAFQTALKETNLYLESFHNIDWQNPSMSILATSKHRLLDIVHKQDHHFLMQLQNQYDRPKKTDIPYIAWE